MSKKTEAKETLKKDKENHYNEISSLKKIMSDYKVERKANWKSFKTKMNDDIGKIEKSINELTTRNTK
jgi:hypothetical protein